MMLVDFEWKRYQSGALANMICYYGHTSMMAPQSLGLAKDKLAVLPWAAEPDTELGDYFLVPPFWLLGAELTHYI